MSNLSPKPWLAGNQLFFVYTFHFIDHTRGFSPSEVYDPIRQEALGTRESEMRDLFTRAGWEGDGRIEIFQIPPVVLPGSGHDGFLIWHVKQTNNGTSWLASEVPLPSIESLEPVEA